MPNGYWIALTAFAVVTAAIPLARWWLMRGPNPGEQACGHCGYLVFGLPSSICPECGHDLNIVGTRRPSRWLELCPLTRLLICLLVWTGWCTAASTLTWRPFQWYVQPCTVLYGESSRRVWGPRESQGPYPNDAAYQRLWRWKQNGTVTSWPIKLPSDAQLIGWRVEVFNEAGRFSFTTERFFSNPSEPEETVPRF